LEAQKGFNKKEEGGVPKKNALDVLKCCERTGGSKGRAKSAERKTILFFGTAPLHKRTALSLRVQWGGGKKKKLAQREGMGETPLIKSAAEKKKSRARISHIWLGVQETANNHWGGSEGGRRGGCSLS